MESDSSPPLNLNTTVGAFHVGVLISYVLFGITTTQVYVYYGRFPDDSRQLKFLIAFVWLCELVHAVSMGFMDYTYAVLDYGHPERVVQKFPLSLVIAVFFGAIIIGITQGFFSYRIYALSQKLYTLVIFWSLTFLCFLGAILIFATSSRSQTTFGGYLHQWEWIPLALWGISAVTDFAIAGTLVFLLGHNRSKRLMKTVALVDKLIKWTIETGLLTSLISIVILICYVKMMENFVWLGLFAIKARLYANSLLASLNSRKTLQRALNNDTTLPIPMPVLNSPAIEISRVTLSYGESRHSDK